MDRVAPERLLHADDLEWFLDDTQLEVTATALLNEVFYGFISIPIDLQL